MGIPLQTLRYIDNGGGVDLKSSPTKVADDDGSDILNTDYSTDGAVFTRNGSTIVNIAAGIPSQMAGAPRTLAMFDYRKADGTQVNVICAGTTIKHSLTTPTSIVTGLSAALPIPDMEFQVTNDDDYLFWGNGVDANLKFDGSDWTNWNLPTPASPTLSDIGAGTLAAGDYYYYVSYARTVGGVIVQESDLSPISSVITIGANRIIRVTFTACSETLAAGVTAQCNARVIYRISPTSLGVAYRHTIINDNVTLTYDDNTADDGTIEANYDRQQAPLSEIFEEYQGCMNIVDKNSSTDLYESLPNLPWNVPSENFEIFDGPIQCVKRVYGVLMIATDRSIWIRNGTLASGAISKRLSSDIGVLNNRCAAGKSTLYVMATNRKVYPLRPTDYSQQEIRIDEPLSIRIEPLLTGLSSAQLSHIGMEYYTKDDVAKVCITCPIGATSNNRIVIFNETQSFLKGKPCWQIWTSKQSALRQFTISNVTNLYGGDYNGFLWKLDDQTLHGDGAEENGTATASGNFTITDTSKTWTVNAYAGMQVSIVTGTSDDEVRTIVSNTADTLTVSAAWAANPPVGSEFSIGGYDSYHFTNWKSVTGSYDTLKQLWYILMNLNASGDYETQLIMQADFDSSITNQTSVNVNLSADNAIWNNFLWGGASWGAMSVFQDRIRLYQRFRAIRFGIKGRKSGQPWQLNSMSLSVQDKGLFYGSAA